MPRMTYSEFDRMVAAQFDDAKHFLERDGFVSNIINGFDVKGRRVFTCISTSAAEDEQERQRLGRQGVFAVPHPMRDFADDIEEVMARAKVVAAIMSAESWVLLGNKVAAQARADNVLPSQHSHRIEVVTVGGYWPREHYAKLLTANIVRNSDGNPRAVSGFGMGTETGDNLLDRLDSWLPDLLPQAPGKPRTSTGLLEGYGAPDTSQETSAP